MTRATDFAMRVAELATRWHGLVGSAHSMTIIRMLGKVLSFVEAIIFSSCFSFENFVILSF